MGVPALNRPKSKLNSGIYVRRDSHSSSAKLALEQNLVSALQEEYDFHTAPTVRQLVVPELIPELMMENLSENEYDPEITVDLHLTEEDVFWLMQDANDQDDN